MVHSALVTRFAVTTDSSSRGGTRVDSIGHHHAASTSLEGTLLLFQPGGREVSPNYCIEGRNIVLVVPEEYRAWTSGSYVDDARSITYEIINSTGSPDWRFSAETLASVIALDIDISRRYGITPRHAVPGYWEHKNLYAWFGRSYATACAGPSFPLADIISRAIAGLAGTAGGGTTPITNGGKNTMYLARVVDGRIFLFTDNGKAYIGTPQMLDLIQRLLRTPPGDFDTFSAAEVDMLTALVHAASTADDAEFQKVIDGLSKLTVDQEAIEAAITAALADVTVDASISAADVAILATAAANAAANELHARLAA